MRVLFGFLLACLVAGATQVAFAAWPDLRSLAGGGSAEQAGKFLALLPLAAAMSAIFASPFAFVAIALAHYQQIRSGVYFALAGLAIGAGGFMALSAADLPGEATIVNAYALKAYLASGFLAGLVYWFVAVPRQAAPISSGASSSGGASVEARV